MGCEHRARRPHQVLHRFRSITQSVSLHILIFKHIERSTAYLSALQSRHQCLGVHHCASGGIDQIKLLGHRRNKLSIKVVTRLLREGDVETHHIGLSLKLRQVFNGLNILKAPKVLIFVIDNHPASEATEPLGKGLAHVAEAYDAHRQRTQLVAAVGLALPQSLAHFGIGTGNVVQQRQQQSHGMITHSIAIAFGRIKTSNAMGFSIVDIDSLHTGTHATYAPQRRHTVDELAVNVHFAPHHQSLAALCGLRQ